MKRYAIVYADGSNRRLTQIDYPSRKEAGDALIYFLTCNNASYSKDDDEYLNPFDFTLKEVEYMTWETKASKKPRRCRTWFNPRIFVSKIYDIWRRHKGGRMEWCVLV